MTHFPYGGESLGRFFSREVKSASGISVGVVWDAVGPMDGHWALLMTLTEVRRPVHFVFVGLMCTGVKEARHCPMEVGMDRFDLHLALKIKMGSKNNNTLPSAVFFLIILSKSTFKRDTTRVLKRIRSDVLSGLIWVQTVCKGYQQTSLLV